MTTDDTKADPATDLPAAVEAKRDEIRAIQDEIQRLEQLPQSRADALAMLDDFLEAKVEEFRESRALTALAYGRRAPGGFWKGPLFGPGDAEAFFVATNRKAIRDVFAEELKALIPEGTPDADAQTERRVVLEGQLLGLECEEENLIRRAAEAGIPIARRADADPRALIEQPEG